MSRLLQQLRGGFRDKRYRVHPGTRPGFDYVVQPPAPSVARRYTAKRQTVHLFDLSAPFTRTLIQFDGTGFAAQAQDTATNTTDGDAFVRVQIDSTNPGGEPNNLGFLVRNGFSQRGTPYSTLHVTNPVAQADKRLEITVWYDTPDDFVELEL